MEISKATFLLVFYLFVASSHAYTFYVGGREGWVLRPSENYSDWSSRNRFQVNDTLVFKYKNGEDSVLVVSQQDFDQCNLSNPIQRMDTGDSVFKFDRSGPFFFVSGTGDRCKQGQKLGVVVLAVRPIVPAPPMAPTLSPGPSPFTITPPTNSPVSPPTISPAPSPFTITPPTNSPVSPPTISPAPSPFTVTPPVPSPSLTPPTGSPASSPSTQPSPSAPQTPAPPNSGTPSNSTGSATPVFRFSSASLAVMVVMLYYGFVN